MEIKVIIDNENKINIGKECFVIHLDDISVLNNIDIDRIFSYLISNDINVSVFLLNDDVIKSIKDYIFYKITINELENVLVENNVMHLAVVKNVINQYSRVYDKLKKGDISTITIECSKDKVSQCITIAKLFGIETVISCTELSLSEYANILGNYTKDELDKMNIIINYQRANSPIHISELYNISQIINKIASDINKYNLSELEKIMYVYDFVKYRIYTNDLDDWRNPRDLDRILSSDSIVCVGYSNLFNAILTSLEIKAMPLISKSANHQRSIVYVKDNKYNIDGIYVFDPTWDSRKENEEDYYLEKYNYFALPLARAKKTAPDNISAIFDMGIDKINEILNGKTTVEEQISLLNLLDSMFMFVFDKTLKELDSITEEEYLLLNQKFSSSELTPDIFVKLLYAVRRIEYVNGITNEFDIAEIKAVVQDRYDRILRSKFDNLYDLIEYSLEIRKTIDESISDIRSQIPNKVGIGRDKENIKLIKVLRKIEDKKKAN